MNERTLETAPEFELDRITAAFDQLKPSEMLPLSGRLPTRGAAEIVKVQTAFFVPIRMFLGSDETTRPNPEVAGESEFVTAELLRTNNKFTFEAETNTFGSCRRGASIGDIVVDLVVVESQDGRLGFVRPSGDE